jgi:hypothetical protein
MTLPPTAIDRLTIPDPRQRAWLQCSLAQTVNHAFASEGWRAFQASERTAAYHEAGHAVLYALADIPVQRVWIKGVKVRGILTWVGECQADVTWEISECSTVAQDLLFARITVAGWCAECLFAPEDMRAGSSIDEAILAGAVCSTAAHKAGRSQPEMLHEVMESVISVLSDHASAVRRIANALMRCRKLHGVQLNRLLPTATVRDAG